MCGISGIKNFKNDRIESGLLIQMRDSIDHRGPDDAGIWIEDNVGLAHRRLSIIDLSEAGHQPFFSDDGNLVMVFNGEIYNFRELGKELEKAGVVLKTATDSEVLIKYFQHYGPACLDRFNGIFAFAVWDRTKKELFIARDRVGVKPFYYSVSENMFCFASEPKAILTCGVNPELNESCFDELLAYRFISGENTIFRNIKKLLPGHYAVLDARNRITIKRWWHLGEKIINHSVIPDPYGWFTSVFADSLRYRMVSDAPVGILLSAGLDSSSITRGLKDSGFENIETFNVGFLDKKYDESSLAERFCKEIGFGFNKIYVNQEDLSDLIEKSGFYLDEPLTHLNDPHLLAISKSAKEKVSVLLSGEGADEFLGGYVRYRAFQYRSIWPYLKPFTYLSGFISGNLRLKKLSKYFKINNTGMMQMMNASNVFPDEFIKDCKLFGINFFPEYRIKILKEAREIYPENPLRQLLYYDQHIYLQSLNDRNDRNTMGAGIECREPFMDYRLMEGIGTIDNDLLFRGKKNKYLLASTIGRRLPQYIQHFRKIGFSVPWPDYLISNKYLKDNLEHLDTCDIFKMGIFAGLNIPRLKKEFTLNRSHQFLIIQLVFIKIWYESYFRLQKRRK